MTSMTAAASGSGRVNAYRLYSTGNVHSNWSRSGGR